MPKKSSGGEGTVKIRYEFKSKEIEDWIDWQANRIVEIRKNDPLAEPEIHFTNWFDEKWFEDKKYSEFTKIGDKRWYQLKKLNAMRESFQDGGWFQELSKEDKALFAAVH